MRNKLLTLNRSIPDHHRQVPLQLRIHPIQPVRQCFGLEATPLRDRSQKNGNSLKQWQTLRANREGCAGPDTLPGNFLLASTSTSPKVHKV